MDGPEEPSNDIDGPATWDNIQTTITNLTEDLVHGDQLAVFFTGVPVNTALAEPRFAFPVNENFSDLYPVSGLSEPMEDIDCGQMIFTFDVNSSADVSWYFEAANGTNVLCQNRYLHGPTGSNEKNYAEMYFSGGNFSEQLFYWASAARGFLPDVYAQAPWNIWGDFGELGLENGGAPYGTYIPGHPGDNYLDDDGDNFIQMGEAFGYANDMNTWSDNGYCYIPYNPFVPPETPYQTDEIPFEEDLITLAGLSGHVESSQEMPARSYIVADALSVDPYVSLTFNDNTEVFINRNSIPISSPQRARIVTYEGSNLFFGEHTDISNSNENYNLSLFYILGNNFQIGNYSLVNNTNLSIPNGIDNLEMNYINFSNSIWYTYYCNSIIIRNCVFYNVFIRTWAEHQVYLADNIFEKSQCIFRGSNTYGDFITIRECSFKDECLFSTYPIESLLYVLWYPNYDITLNRFQSGVWGVEILESGWDYQSDFNNNTIVENDEVGIFIQFSKASLKGNEISNNGSRGLWAIDNSNIELSGNKGANFVNETQRIMDNGQYEVYFDNSSFPVPFKWNAITDDDNLPVDDELLYCQGIMLMKDVRYNFWGNNFDPEEDFFPVGAYNYEPIFELIYEGEEKSDAEQLYETAQGKFEQEDYTGAKNDFQQVVQQYPDSRFANASIKQLYALEQYEANDYSALKQYFRTNTDILNDSSLTKLGDFLANRCDIKLENWPTAITWFENVILNPPSFADSIYSIIDLGNTYLLMQQGGYKSSSYMGSMAQYIPESDIAHIEHTHYLLSLLPGDKKKKPLQENLEALKSGELLQNIPNPFKGSTQIYYKLEKAAAININVYSYTGQLIKTYNEGMKTGGVHYVEFSSEALPAGMYFYSIKVNGKTSDSKKMMVVR